MDVQGLDAQGLDVQGLGDPEDPVVLLIGPPERLSADGRRWVRALVEAGRHVLLAPLDEADGEGAAVALRALLTELSSRPAVLCSAETLAAVHPALVVTGPALVSCLIVVGAAPALAERLGTDVQLEAKGGLLVAQTEASHRELRAHAETMAAAGLSVELLDPAAAREAEPVLRPDLAGAALFAEDMQLCPLRLVVGLALAAERPGANLNALLDENARDPLTGNAVLSGVAVELEALAP